VHFQLRRFRQPRRWGAAPPASDAFAASTQSRGYSHGCSRNSIHISDYLDLNRNQTAILRSQPLFAALDNSDLLAHRHKPWDTKLEAAEIGASVHRKLRLLMHCWQVCRFRKATWLCHV